MANRIVISKDGELHKVEVYIGDSLHYEHGFLKTREQALRSAMTLWEWYGYPPIIDAGAETKYYRHVK